MVLSHLVACALVHRPQKRWALASLCPAFGFGHLRQLPEVSYLHHTGQQATGLSQDSFC